MIGASLQLFLHKYVYKELCQTLVCNITSLLDVFSIEPNGYGFKARVKKGNIKRGETALDCYNECLSQAFYSFFISNSTYIVGLYNLHFQEFDNLDITCLLNPNITNMVLFYNIALLPDNYIQINI